MATKTLTPHDLVGLQSTFTQRGKNAQNSSFPNVGSMLLDIQIDSIRLEVLKNTIIKTAKKLNFELYEVKKNSKISTKAKKKKHTKEITSSHYIQTPSGFKNILLETPHELNQRSDYKKYLLTIFGLSQPNKPLSQDTINEILNFIKNLEVFELDISIDSTKPLSIEALLVFGAINKSHATSYINRPMGLAYITKLCYYNKQFKDQLEAPLYRLELTCKSKGKLLSDLYQWTT